MTALEYLRLDQNSFSGEMPFELQSLVHLEHLDISDQRSRGGRGLEGPLPDFSSVKELTELIVSGNALTGLVPSTLMENADLDSVITIDLRNNRFEGHVPTHLRKFDNLKLYLAKNKIDEMNEGLCPGTSLWLNGDIAEFGCDGLMCAPGTYNSEGRQAHADDECEVCESPGVAAYFGSTKCKTGISTSPDDNADSSGDTQRDILTHFYKKCGGSIWNNSTNWLTDKNVCQWYGIECYNDGSELNDEIKTINLRSNKVHDTPPHELFRLPHSNTKTVTKKKNSGIALQNLHS